MKTNYYITGFPFNSQLEKCTEQQALILDSLIKLFWGDDRSARVQISIRYRGEGGSGSRCSSEYPICMTRMHDPDDCTCSGFESQRGGNEIIITRGKPRFKKHRTLQPAEAQ